MGPAVGDRCVHNGDQLVAECPDLQVECLLGPRDRRGDVKVGFCASGQNAGRLSGRIELRSERGPNGLVGRLEGADLFGMIGQIGQHAGEIVLDLLFVGVEGLGDGLGFVAAALERQIAVDVVGLRLDEPVGAGAQNVRRIGVVDGQGGL